MGDSHRLSRRRLTPVFEVTRVVPLSVRRPFRMKQFYPWLEGQHAREQALPLAGEYHR